MKLMQRKYRCDDDYWAVRQFLREVFLLNGRRELSWPLYRWDYWRWHVNANIFRFSLEAAVFLWETAEGRLAAVLHPDGPGEAFLEVHPAFRSAELEVAMLSVAETQFATTQADGSQRLVLWAHEGDTLRRDLLARRGYVRHGSPEHQRRRPMDQPIPDFRPAEGYAVRALGDEAELPARSWVSWRAFHPDEPDDKYEGWEWYRNVQRAPLYRRDLDLVAVAPDGELAGFLHGLVRRRDPHRGVRAGGHAPGAPAQGPGQGAPGRGAAPGRAPRRDPDHGWLVFRCGRRALRVGGIHRVRSERAVGVRDP